MPAPCTELSRDKATVIECRSRDKARAIECPEIILLLSMLLGSHILNVVLEILFFNERTR